MSEKKTDLRIIKTHKALCETFMTLCSKKHFEEITVGELCDLALVRRATFYKHFADKYDFFAFFVRYVQDEMVEEFRQKETADSNQPGEYYVYLFTKLVEYIEAHISMVNNLLNSTAFSSLIDILSQEIGRNIYIHLSERKEEGLSIPTSIPIIAAFLSGGTVQLVRYWLTNPDTVKKEDIFESYNVILNAGFYSIS